MEVIKWNDIENLLTNGKKMSQQQKLTQQQTGCRNLTLLKLSVEDALLCHSDLVTNMELFMDQVSDTATHCQYPLQSLLLVSSLAMGNDMPVLQHHPSFPCGIYLAVFASKHSKQKKKVRKYERMGRKRKQMPLKNEITISETPNITMVSQVVSLT